MSEEKNSDVLKEAALAYHRYPTPGKLAVRATKPLGTQRDLALAYSPGVAAACEAIVADPETARDYTARGNLVGVVSNGSAVLGLGNIGALAGKPVMEGKAVLFKKFADIDVFDIEVDATTVDEMCTVIGALEPTFGGINLEDIKAPECFEVERRLREKMNIPVFHDDQHGTAIIVAAAVANALELVDKAIGEVKIVASGAGAAALACLNLLVSMGAKRENIWVCDIEGLVYEGRAALMDEYKSVFAQKSELRTLGEVVEGADIFLGLSAPRVLKPAMVEKMARDPLIMALANPTPEIMPDEAKAVRPDAILCTGRSDFPNQVNNVLCFPYIFRGALDCGATAINEEMKLAASRAIAALARKEASDVAARAYGGAAPVFGRDYLIPTPFDPRLVMEIAPAVAIAAEKSGVALRPITDMDAYCERMMRFVFRSGLVMKPIFAAARSDLKRVVYADGEDDRVLMAVQAVVDDGLAQPILIGRPEVIDARIERRGLRIRAGEHFELVNPNSDSRFREYVDLYLKRMGRRGVTPDAAQTIVRTRTTAIAALAVARGEADAMLCGLDGRFRRHLEHIDGVIGKAEGVIDYSALSLMLVEGRAIFFCDTHVSYDPTAREVAEMTLLAARHIRRFGMTPKVALLSHSDFGASTHATAAKMREALALIRAANPDFEVDGEMHADTALAEDMRRRILPDATLTGAANLLVFPGLDAAHLGFGLTKALADGLPIGPILIGAAKPAHIITPSITARGIVNMTAVAAVEARAVVD